MRPHAFLHVFALLTLLFVSSSKSTKFNNYSKDLLPHHKIRHQKQDGFQQFYQFLNDDCMTRGVKAPHVSKAFGPRYLKRKMETSSELYYLIAVYECQSGYKFLGGQHQNVLYCSNGKWIGARPICTIKNHQKGIAHVQADQAKMKSNNGKISNKCPKCNKQFEECRQDHNEEWKCLCKIGFKRTNDGICKDINECKVANPCQHSCTNLPGAYRCHCKTGYRLLPDGETCEDVNECLLRNGHGPCEDQCVNLLGSYSCACDEKKGSMLALDGHTCDDVDECDVGTSGCSHGCINTRGRAYCSCPDGMFLGADWKTCIDKPLGDQPIQDEYYDEENEGEDEYINGEDDGDYNEEEEQEEEEDDEDEDERGRRNYGVEEDEEDDAREDTGDDVIEEDDRREDDLEEDDREEDDRGEDDRGEDNKDGRQASRRANKRRKGVKREDIVQETDDDLKNDQIEEERRSTNVEQDFESPKAKETALILANEESETKTGPEERNDNIDKDEQNKDININKEDTNVTSKIEESSVPKEEGGSDKVAAVIRDLELNFGKNDEDFNEDEDFEKEDIEEEEVNEEKADKEDEEKRDKEEKEEDLRKNYNEQDSLLNIETKRSTTNIPENTEATTGRKEEEEEEPTVISRPSPSSKSPNTMKEDDEEIKEETLTKTHVYQLGNEANGSESSSQRPEYVSATLTTPKMDPRVHGGDRGDYEKDNEHDIIDIDTNIKNGVDAERDKDEEEAYEPDEYDQESEVVTSTTTQNLQSSVQTITTPVTDVTTTRTTSTALPVAHKNITTNEDDVDADDDDENDYEYTYEEYEDSEHGNTVSPSVATITTPKNDIPLLIQTPSHGKCSPGYKPSNNDCIDINECEDPEHGCSDLCENTLGSYTCACPTGYEITPGDKYTCVDIDECALGTCSHDCFNSPGSFTCECPAGYILKDHRCFEVNCQHGFNLTETSVTGYICLCPKGYSLDVNGTCEDINECADENLCEHECRNIDGGYLCSCDEGYTSIGNDCDDIDECLEDNGGCQQLCANFEGSHECGCEDGYLLDEDGRSCLEVDHCGNANGNCSDVCKRQKGAPYVLCECQHGRELQEDGKTCLNINPCHIDNGGCSHDCVYKEMEGVECVCPRGHQLLIDARTCEEFNPCFEENGGCSHLCLTNETHPQEVICKCPDNSYKLEGKTCFKINPCLTDNGGCSHGCHFDDDEVKCSCPDTFKLFGKICQKRNQCEENNGGCSHFCNFVNDTIICECPNGFELLGKSCKKIDPCLINNGGCSHACIEEDDEVECHCPINYELMEDQKTCKAIDPCYNNGGCSHFCLAHRGRTLCYCPLGYELKDDKVCAKIDLCLDNNGNCSHTCHNHLGKVECQCPSDLVLVNSTQCVNPCSMQNGGCSHECLFETETSRTKCLCPEGFLLKTDGKTCKQQNPCFEDNGGCSHSCDNVNGQVVCKCPDSNATRYELIGKTCKLIDPCLVNNGGCSHTCVTLNQQAKCECPTNFTLEGIGKCVANLDNVPEHSEVSDPCTVDNGGCSHNCSTQTGGVEPVCFCPPGFLLRPNKKMCKDINECIRHNGGCSHTCRNMPGGYKCLCPKGFRLQGNNHTCITGHIKACTLNNGGCEHFCEDLKNGGHRCTCKLGFDLLSDGKSCEEASSFFECHVKALDHGRVKCTIGGADDYVAVGSQCLYSCDKGFKLSGGALRTCEYSGEWDLEEPVCSRISSCPKLIQPLKGRIIPHICSMGKTRKGETCGVHCRTGYRLSRLNLANFTCEQHGDKLEWSVPVTEELLKNACVQHELPRPFIRCPSGGKMSFVLPTGARVMTVRINRPESNVDWWRYVTSVPLWGKQLTTVLPPGRFEVTFTALSPHPQAQNLSASCNLVIHVKDDEPPKVFNCPSNQEVRLERGEYSKNVYWSEPSFEDNIGIRTVYKSKDSGAKFPYGLHHVNYIASDDAGNRAYCHFSINVVNYYQHEYSPNNRMMTKYRSVLICPHGIQYMSNSPDNYDNSITSENGCKWTYIRLRNQMGQPGYRIPIPGYQQQHQQQQQQERSNQIRDIPTPAPTRRHHRERFSWSNSHF